MFAPSDPLSFPAVREFTSSVYEKERKGYIDRTRTSDVVSEKERERTERLFEAFGA